MRALLPIVLLASGLVLVVAGVVQARPPVAPARPDEVAAVAPTSGPPALSSPSYVPAVPPTPAPVPAELGGGWRIRIARVGIDLPVKDGDAARDVALQKTPDGAAYRLVGSALPGNAGNTYLYGHARSAQFIGLWYAHLDDQIVLSGPGGTLRYRVIEIHPRVATDDITYLLPTSDERLTLQTSSGPNATDPRFVVVAAPER